MRARRFDGILPAAGPVTVETAEALMELLTSSGPAVLTVLQRAGVFTGTGELQGCGVDERSMERLLVDHCTVVCGHLPTKYWKRLRRSTGEALPYAVCTCLTFTQHAECEHHAFARALQGGQPNLNAVPVLQKRGRPGRR